MISLHIDLYNINFADLKFITASPGKFQYKQAIYRGILAENLLWLQSEYIIHMDNEPSPTKIKLIAVGSSGVGKSSILVRLSQDVFNEFSETTLGAAYIPHKMALPNGQQVILDMWDTAGQEKYRNIVPMYYRDTKIAICVYDITSQASYDEAKYWVDQIQTNGPRGVILAVVGNKADLYEEETVEFNAAKTYAQSLGALFRVVSAKDGKNIKELFQELAQRAVGINVKNSKKQSGYKINPHKDVKKSKCC